MVYLNYSHKQPDPKYPQLTKEFLIAQRDAGKTVSQIAEDTGIPRGTISSHLRANGISK